MLLLETGMPDMRLLFCADCQILLLVLAIYPGEKHV
jgi:hypothetical protein